MRGLTRLYIFSVAVSVTGSWGWARLDMRPNLIPTSSLELSSSLENQILSSLDDTTTSQPLIPTSSEEEFGEFIPDFNLVPAGFVELASDHSGESLEKELKNSHIL